MNKTISLWKNEKESSKLECVEVMGAKAPRGPSRGTPGSPNKIFGCRRLPVFEVDKGMSLKIEKRKWGSQTWELAEGIGERLLGDPAEEPLGVPMEFWVQTALCGRALTTKDNCSLTSKHASLISSMAFVTRIKCCFLMLIPRSPNLTMMA